MRLLSWRMAENPRVVFTLKPEDRAYLEPLRVKLALRSHGAVLRKALRDLATREGLKKPSG
jgi:hypothetical protein